jgi:6-phosphogluconolactonase
MRRVEVFPDAAALAAAAAEAFVLASRSAAGRFRVALSGGNTPRALLTLLADESAPYRAGVPWDDVHFFWSDERCVPPDDMDSNFKMADDALLSRLPIDKEQVHRVLGELPDPDDAARRYEETIKSEFKGPPVFDLIYLGMGPDGHTASLFPNTKAVAERERLVVSNYVEQKKSYRVTFTLPLLNSSKAVHFLVAGPDKAETARKVLNEAPSAASPASLVQPAHGDVVWFLDESAARRLKPEQLAPE